MGGFLPNALRDSWRLMPSQPFLGNDSSEGRARSKAEWGNCGGARRSNASKGGGQVLQLLPALCRPGPGGPGSSELQLRIRTLHTSLCFIVWPCASFPLLISPLLVSYPFGPFSREGLDGDGNRVCIVRSRDFRVQLVGRIRTARHRLS